MPQPVFLSQETRKPYEYDPDIEAYVRIQYSGDWFAQIKLGENEKLVTDYNGEAIPLDFDRDLDGYRLKDKRPKHKPIREEMTGSAGLIQLLISTTDGDTQLKPLSPGLWTLPASLSEDDYRELLDQLKTLAIRTGSTVSEYIPVLEAQAKRERTVLPQSKYEQLAVDIIQLITQVEALWPLILENPSCELKQSYAVIRFDKAAAVGSAKTISQTVRYPGRTYITAHVPNNSFDTQENRFLAYLFQDVALSFGDTILRELRKRIRALKKKSENQVNLPAKIPDRLRSQFNKRLQDQRRKLQCKNNELEQLCEELQSAQEKAKRHLSEPIIKAAMRNRRSPEHPSQKLIQSFAYQPIYQRYSELNNAINLKGALKSIANFEQLELRSVRPLPNLYEIWLFLEIYRSLVEDFHFKPVNLPPADYLKHESDGIELTKDHPFRLEFSEANPQSGRTNCQIDMVYEPVWQAKPCGRGKSCFNQTVCQTLPCYQKIMVNKDWAQRLTPDISIVVRVEQKEFRFAIDAKYRSYRDQSASRGESKLYGYDDPFFVDVLGIAKMKYLNALDLDGAFIVHTDLNEQWNFWGGEPFPETPQREKMLLKSGYWPGHKFGATYATPLVPDNLQILLKCILMYHAGLTNICWRCAKRLTVVNGGATPGECPVTGTWTEQQIVERVEAGQYSAAAVYYLCPDCGEFWILQRCYRGKHPLIKLGTTSFHSFSKIHPGNLWLNICPQCGSDLPEEFQRTPNPSENY